ncbi:hypothetical protein KEM55_002283 [Ascosphaera atra]|nr:hypothetical protein KEM55_002283 [Ascosphaera atra]
MPFSSASHTWIIYALILAASRQVHAKNVSTSWYPPKLTKVNKLNAVLNGTSTDGFIFKSSITPDREYGKYNRYNMPHVRPADIDERYRYNDIMFGRREFSEQYIWGEEAQSQHCYRYASTAFPKESYPWDFDDEDLFIYGRPSHDHSASPVQCKGYTGPKKPFQGELDDAWQHGRDIYATYYDLLGFLPAAFDPEKVVFWITNTMITSQAAGMIVNGMFGESRDVPLLVQPRSVNSLEPQHNCPYYDALWSKIRSASPNSAWSTHLTRTAPLMSQLDTISDVPNNGSQWHTSYGNYFDNLSSRLCHSKPLPSPASPAPPTTLTTTRRRRTASPPPKQTLSSG